MNLRPAGRLRNIHSFQLTENYIVIPETSYLQDPCSWVQPESNVTGWNRFCPESEAA